MADQFLISIIPESNRFDLSIASRGVGTSCLEQLYSLASKFVGVFLDQDDQPGWARRAARYLVHDFRHNTPGTKKQFGDVLPSLTATGDGECFPNWRPALEAWIAGGKQGVEPYSTSQDYGSCVDASAAEHTTALLGWRAARPEFGETYKHPAAWYWYANRGYCSDGWSGAGCAAVALRCGVAFRIPYNLADVQVDFTDDDRNERIVAREWCRTGIPSWLVAHTKTHHPFEDGAITEFEGGFPELKKLFTAGGVLHTSGTRTSGGSKPFTISSVGPHMQSAVGCDDSEEFRKFCRDVIGVTPRASDFPVIMNQTWGPGWSGECADKYWPSWWGPKPQGAWVWWASDVLKRLSCDYAWLPRVKGFPGVAPPPPGPVHPPITGDLYGEKLVSGKIAIRGEVALKLDQEFRYIAVPNGQHFKLVPKPEV